MYKIVYILILGSLFGGSEVQVEGQLEKCRKRQLRPQSSFDIQSYLGGWHPQRFAPTKAHQASRGPGGSCLTVNISRTAQPNVFDYNEEWYTTVGYGYLSGPTKAKGQVYLNLEQPSVWTIDYDTPGSYQKQRAEGVVLATVPNAWAVEYHCAVRSGEIEERIVVLGRSRQVHPDGQKMMDIIMANLGVPSSNIVSFPQHYCPT